VVEGARLESVYTVKGIKGSNPFLSASYMKNKKIINWGIIGLGNAAKNFASGFCSSENSRLVAIASKDYNKINFFREKFFINKKYCFTDYESITKCKDIDIIYIALPNSFHKEWIINCALNKKNILVEKPSVLNFLDIKEALMVVKKNKVFLMEGFLYKCHPQTFKLIEILKSNLIGTVFNINSSFGNDALGYKSYLGIKIRKKPNNKKRLFNKKLGGGAIFDMGCYPLSMTRMIAYCLCDDKFKEPKFKSIKNEIGITGVVESSKADLVFRNKKNDIIANIETSIIKKLKNVTEIKGTKGSILVEHPWFPESNSKIYINNREGTKAVKSSKNDVNIYANQITYASQCLLNNLKEALFPATNINDILLNAKCLGKWSEELT
jgi:predicted dehydrogenase